MRSSDACDPAAVRAANIHGESKHESLMYSRMGDTAEILAETDAMERLNMLPVSMPVSLNDVKLSNSIYFKHRLPYGIRSRIIDFLPRHARVSPPPYLI
jgi:hypothetical protein